MQLHQTISTANIDIVETVASIVVYSQNRTRIRVIIFSQPNVEMQA